MENKANKVLFDASKDYNAFRWIYTVFFGAWVVVIADILLIFFSKLFNNGKVINFLPFFNPNKFPVEHSWVVYCGLFMLVAMGLLMLYAFITLLLWGKVITVSYLPSSNSLIIERNGMISKPISIPVIEVRKLSRKSQSGINSIHTGQHYIPTINLTMNKAYLIFEDNKRKPMLFFEHYDKKKHNAAYSRIRKLILEKRQEA